MSRFRHLVALAGAACLIVGASLVPSAPAQAATDSQTFDVVGSADFVVPAGVIRLTIDTHGAQGGNSNGGPPNPQGGLGGRTFATVTVTPGETVQVNVGGAGGNGASGSSNGGANGGGAGAGTDGISGGGGGASDVRRGGTAVSDRVVVAGGGGGAGAFVVGGDGGAGGGDAPTAGENGSNFDFDQGLGGGAGSGVAGGSGGGGQVTGASGSAGQGGAGALGLDDGGGGGGGWFGGGGGGAGDSGGGGGGGGSGHAEASATDVGVENGVRSGDGMVVLTWEVPVATTTTTTSTPTSTTTAPTPAPTTSTTTPGAEGPSASYSTGGGSLTVEAGGLIDLRGGGWSPAGSVEVTMYSEPVRLGSMTASESGAVAGTFSIPRTTPLGAHRIELLGTSATKAAATVELQLQVTAPASSLPTVPTPPAQTLRLTG